MKYVLISTLIIVSFYMTSCSCKVAGLADINCDPQFTAKERGR